MKVWQLFSLARGQDDLIERTASEKAAWRPYLEIAQTFGTRVAQQRGDILDTVVDKEFAQAVTRQLSRKLYLSGNQLCSRRRGLLDRTLTIHEAVQRFGGDAVEDAFEYGSVVVGP